MLNCYQRPAASEQRASAASERNQQQQQQPQQRAMASAQITAAATPALCTRTNHYYEQQQQQQQPQNQQHQNHHQQTTACNEMIDAAYNPFSGQSEDSAAGDLSNLDFNQLFAAGGAADDGQDDEFRISPAALNAPQTNGGCGAGRPGAGSGASSPSSQQAAGADAQAQQRRRRQQQQQQQHAISALGRLEDALDSTSDKSAAGIKRAEHHSLDHFLMDNSQSLAADSQMMLFASAGHEHGHEREQEEQAHQHHQRELYSNTRWDHPADPQEALADQHRYDFRLGAGEHENDFMSQSLESSTPLSTKSVARSPTTTTTQSYNQNNSGGDELGANSAPLCSLGDYNNNGHEHNLNGGQQPARQRQDESQPAGSLSFAPLVPLAMAPMAQEQAQGLLHSTPSKRGGQQEELDYYQLAQYSYAEQTGNGASSELIVSSSSSSSDTSPYSEHQPHQQQRQQQHLDHHHQRHSNSMGSSLQDVPSQQYHQASSSPPQQRASFEGQNYTNGPNNFQDYYQSGAQNYHSEQQQQQQQLGVVSNCYGGLDSRHAEQEMTVKSEEQHFEGHFMQGGHSLLEGQPRGQHENHHHHHNHHHNNNHHHLNHNHQQHHQDAYQAYGAYHTHQAYQQQQQQQEPVATKGYAQQEQVAPGAAEAGSPSELLVVGQLTQSCEQQLLALNATGQQQQAQPQAQTFSEAKANNQQQQQTKITGFRGRQLRGRPRKKKSGAKGKVSGKLWEFIRDLLLSECTNPSFIRWERREDGVFKFVQSDKVAKMWGERKQNPKMTYEKLSRAMRYYYKSKVLLPVFGRRLVYKFGPNATGWMSAAQQQQFDQNKLQQQQQQQQSHRPSCDANETQVASAHPTATGHSHNGALGAGQQQHQQHQQHQPHHNHSQHHPPHRLEGFY